MSQRQAKKLRQVVRKATAEQIGRHDSYIRQYVLKPKPRFVPRRLWVALRGLVLEPHYAALTEQSGSQGDV